MPKIQLTRITTPNVGVGGDDLTVSDDTHRQLLASLAQNPDEYWTGCYPTIMQHVRGLYPR